MGKYFGTDGFRGEANVKLTADHAFRVGRYLGWYYGRDHKAKIVIGKDTRRSSYMFEYALAAGLVMLLFGNKFLGLIAVIAGVGMVLNHFSKKKDIENKRQNIAERYEKKRSSGSEIIRATLADVRLCGNSVRRIHG